jgi:hypothetical protein
MELSSPSLGSWVLGFNMIITAQKYSGVGNLLRVESAKGKPVSVGK